MYFDERDERSATKVFVVDDDPVVLEIVREWLTNAGYSVQTRDRALGTANWVAAEKPDYVLLDVKMPALSGEELALLMRRSRATAGSAIILHSTLESTALGDLARKTGAIGAIQKTSNSRMFLAEFERLLSQYRALQARSS
jgi:DNA-binding response OmpR family regulator